MEVIIVLWIIDVDHTVAFSPSSYEPGTNLNAVGVIGPRDADKSKVSTCIHRFRMYDGDDELYYEGRASEVSFAPLDDFGRPNAGCTGIKFIKDGQWEWL